jgi:hypothetical protein
VSEPRNPSRRRTKRSHANAAKAAGDEATRRGFVNAANMTFGLLKAEVLAVYGGGWCEARMLDGDFCGWLCAHIHATAQEAEDCPNKDSLLRPEPSWGLNVTDCREPDIDWNTGQPRRRN